MPRRPVPPPPRTQTQTKTQAQAQAQALKAGIAAYQRGAFGEAWRLLSALPHPQALNIAAVAAQRLGQPADAANAFNRATTLAPNDADIANNYGHFELTQGATDTADALFDTALRNRPGLLAARIGKAKVAAARKDWTAAASHWQACLAAAPHSVEARYGLAMAALETGQPEAAADRLRALLVDHDQPEMHFMLGRALLALGEAGAALPPLQTAHARQPTDYTLRTLANLHWMQRDTAAFRKVIDEAPPALSAIAIKLLLETEDTASAQAMWDRRFGPGGVQVPDADGWTLAAQIARIGGDGRAAADAADRALALAPGHDSATDSRIVAALMLGDAPGAMARLAPAKANAPHAQNWIAHEAVAQRLLGQTGPGSLNDTARFVRAYDIDTPEGHPSLEAFNAALADRLRALHPFSARPLDQSLRGHGTQTSRSLLESDDPIIQQYIRALDAPIRRYLADIGTEQDHPTSRRNNGKYAFRGMWSVRLTGSGYHDAHVHPEGWISSAYYVVVPGGTERAADQSGWIGFGKPPYPTQPSLDALEWIAPRPGRLVLFPSYMWHGTRPIANGEERITAPFDLLPG